MRPHLVPVFLLPWLLVFVAGCATPAAKPRPRPVPKIVLPAGKPGKAYWEGDQVPGDPLILVSLARQRAYFYKAEALVGQSPVSSGRRGFETPRGSFKVIQRDEKHVSNLYGDFIDPDGNVVKANVDASKEPPLEGALFRGAPMPYFLRFSGGFGLHAGKIPGYRASHGCVRLPRKMARHFYENAPLGTPVIVE